MYLLCSLKSDVSHSDDDQSDDDQSDDDQSDDDQSDDVSHQSDVGHSEELK